MANMITAVTAIANSILVLVALSGIPSSAIAAETVSGKVQQRQKQPEAYQERLINWLLEDPDGFFHPAILWKQLGPDGKSGPYAMHATEDIPKGTPLIVLPRKYVLESHLAHEDDEDVRMCVTVDRMLDEYNKHIDDSTAFKSFYAPYLTYLFEGTVGGTTAGLLPASWSDHSKLILDLILEINEYEDDDEDEWGEYSLTEFLFRKDSVFDICSGAVWENRYKHAVGDNNLALLQQAEDAYLFMLSRGWFDMLLPIVDIVNHRNGPSRNVEITPINSEEDNDVAAYAWRNISKGEQLQYTYSECMDATCEFGEARYWLSTQFIFVEYGFVELYPQRWFFDRDQSIIAEVTTDTTDETKKVFKWIFESPNEQSILWIREQLARLKSIESTVRGGVRELETVLLQEGIETTIYNIDHERDTILELYEGFVQVFELALEHKDDPVAVTKESFDEEIEELRETAVQLTVHELRKHELLLSSASTPLHNGDEF